MKLSPAGKFWIAYFVGLVISVVTIYSILTHFFGA